MYSTTDRASFTYSTSNTIVKINFPLFLFHIPSTLVTIIDCPDSFGYPPSCLPYFCLYLCNHLAMSSVTGKRARTSNSRHSGSKRPSGGNSRTQHVSKKQNSQGSPSLSKPSDLSNVLAVLDTQLDKFPSSADKRTVDKFLWELTEGLVDALIKDVTAPNKTSSTKSAFPQRPRTPKSAKSRATSLASGTTDSANLTKPLTSHDPSSDSGNPKPLLHTPTGLTPTDDPRVEEVVIESGHVNDHLSPKEPRPRHRVKRVPKRRHSPSEEVLVFELSKENKMVPSEQDHAKKRPKPTTPTAHDASNSKDSSDTATGLTSMTVNGVGFVAGGSRLPWWRSTQNRVTVLDDPPNLVDIFRGYVTAIVKASVNASWTTADIRAAFDGDPCSEKGKAFREISTALVLMERARHMGHCRAKWHHEIVSGLVSRRHARWSKLSVKKESDFVGCDICASVRPATERLILSGENFDGREFWPSRVQIDILSMKKLSDSNTYSLTVEVNREAAPNNTIRKNAENRGDDKTYFVDSQCLRQCLVFHRLVHATSTISGEVRGLIEDELREGVVELKVKSGLGDRSVLDALEEELMNCVMTHTDFLNRQVERLLDTLKLGDLYLSAEEWEEVIDSGCAEDELKRTKNNKPTIYDAPLYLRDEHFVAQVTRLIAMSQVFGS